MSSPYLVEFKLKSLNISKVITESHYHFYDKCKIYNSSTKKKLYQKCINIYYINLQRLFSFQNKSYVCTRDFDKQRGNKVLHLWQPILFAMNYQNLGKVKEKKKTFWQSLTYFHSIGDHYAWKLLQLFFLSDQNAQNLKENVIVNSFKYLFKPIILTKPFSNAIRTFCYLIQFMP